MLVCCNGIWMYLCLVVYKAIMPYTIYTYVYLYIPIIWCLLLNPFGFVTPLPLIKIDKKVTPKVFK